MLDNAWLESARQNLLTPDGEGAAVKRAFFERLLDEIRNSEAQSQVYRDLALLIEGGVVVRYEHDVKGYPWFVGGYRSQDLAKAVRTYSNLMRSAGGEAGSEHALAPVTIKH